MNAPKMTRDMILKDASRALKAAFPDRWDALMRELENRIPPEGFRLVVEDQEFGDDYDDEEWDVLPKKISVIVAAGVSDFDPEVALRQESSGVAPMTPGWWLIGTAADGRGYRRPTSGIWHYFTKDGRPASANNIARCGGVQLYGSHHDREILGGPLDDPQPTIEDSHKDSRRLTLEHVEGGIAPVCATCRKLREAGK